MVKNLPNLDGLTQTRYERYFLFINKKVELRIQKKDKKIELERIVQIGNGRTDKTKLVITKDEFDSLKKVAIGKIERDSYTIQDSPEIVIRFYKGLYKGLVRVETDTEEIPKWFGKEITDNVLGRDGKLMALNRNKFLELLNKLSL